MADIAPATVVMVAGPEVIIALLAGVMAQAIVVADLVAELVTHRAIQREDAVTAAQAMTDHAVAVDATGVVYHRRLGQVRVFLAGHAGAGHAEVSQVDAGAEGRLGGVFTHVAAVHVTGSGACRVVDDTTGDHHA